MTDVMTMMNQSGKPVLIVMGILLALLLLALVYSALVMSSRADEQSEREWEVWRQEHPDQRKYADGSGV